MAAPVTAIMSSATATRPAPVAAWPRLITMSSPVAPSAIARSDSKTLTSVECPP